MTEPQKELHRVSRRAFRAVAQVLLLVIVVPLGIIAGWMVMAPSAQNLAARAAGGGDSAALLELVERAPQQAQAAEELQFLLGNDENALRALVDLAAGHESALQHLMSVAHKNPERLGQLSGVNMSYPFAVTLLQHMKASGMGRLQEQAQTRAAAAFVLGVAYENGLHVSQDWAQAARCYDSAIRMGFEQASAYYAMAAYEAGVRCWEDVERRAEAVAWFRPAAEQGHAAAQCVLGMCYHNGTGVPCDRQQALAWLEKSAAQGYVDAMFNMGWCLLGDGYTKEDAAVAASWFQKAAYLGDGMSQYYLGQLYETGEGVTQNPRLAFRWYSRAAEQGCNLAQYSLSNCYENGIGVPRNADAARYWLQLADKESQTSTENSEL